MVSRITAAMPQSLLGAASAPTRRNDALVARVLRRAHRFAARVVTGARGAITPVDGEYQTLADCLASKRRRTSSGSGCRRGNPPTRTSTGICLSELTAAPADASLEWRARIEVLPSAVDQRYWLSATGGPRSCPCSTKSTQPSRRGAGPSQTADLVFTCINQSNVAWALKAQRRLWSTRREQPSAGRPSQNDRSPRAVVGWLYNSGFARLGGSEC